MSPQAMIDVTGDAGGPAISSSNGGACVEVALIGQAVAVRDSKDPEGPKLGSACRY
ncbi:MAG TPA: DUF397 domain-containing protein [Streptosporangiaceae bacterium]|nr:DUF397 domain-containing protein [Streptosporangiaceae bacterium]